MQIDDKLIAYLEDLSCLTLIWEEKDRLADDLSSILRSMAHLVEVDTSGVPVCSHPFDDVNAFREDEVQASFDRELILLNAPEHNGCMFIAPSALES